jgi:hypothetical protein
MECWSLNLSKPKHLQKRRTETNGAIKGTDEERKYLADRLWCKYQSASSETASQRSKERYGNEIREAYFKTT